jgi:hypothetical protein
MSTAPALGLTVSDLESALTRVDPAVLLVPPRILRRVIKRDRGLTGLGLRVPHRKSYVLPCDHLLDIADRHELGLAPDRALPDVLILLPRPDRRRLAARPRAEALLGYWRLLYHARVHQALDRRRGAGRLGDAAVRERIARLGQTEFAEVREVLRQENFLLPPGDDPAAYEEFVALYLELRHFFPHLLPRYFPAFVTFDAVDRVLAEDVDGAALFAATRPDGAADPAAEGAPRDGAGPGNGPCAEPAAPDPDTCRRLLESANRAAGRGNVARAAVLRRRAGHADVAGEALGELTARLQRALGLSDEEAAEWRQCLLPLLGPAARDVLPVETRLLFDLQKVCIDHERVVYAVDLVEWFVTWGRRPVKRLLPNQRQVLMVKHLGSALNRLTAARMPEEPRRRLVALVREAIRRTEKELRDRLRPLIGQALDEVNLRPRNYAERLARHKLTEELLDRVAERGYLNMSDLRDALARNRLKIPDLSGPREFILGDPLIRANRRFAVHLDGVYHRGEIYLRWLQRLSSLAFGTATGRLLTLYFLLPVVGAFLGIKGAEELLEIGQKIGRKLTGQHVEHVHGSRSPFPNLYLWGTVSVFVLGLLH